ncbi:hypothetical protein BC941DRAFT_380142 [Chlamydoabsidia padenii]|nr:hypothetical protein BC941DRAFT_380142 [Chlamydoabsidia padenii]
MSSSPPSRKNTSQDSSESDDETLQLRRRGRYENERDDSVDHRKRSRRSRHSRSPSIDRKRHRQSRRRYTDDSSSQDDEGGNNEDDDDDDVDDDDRRRSRSNTHYDERDRRRPPHSRGIEPANPDTFDYIIPFKQYCDYLRYTHPYKRFDDHDSRRRYDRYKDAFHAKQLANFFEANKDKQWFLEKYHPVLSEPRKQELKQRRLRYLDQFMEELDQGLMDQVVLDEGESYHGVDIKEGQQQQQDDDDDIYENRLVIKTVLPTIPRENILKLCETMEGFDYLALSEPGPNRRFHRIGWINFKKGTDMQEAFNKLDKQVVDDFIFHLAMNKKNQEPLIRTPRLALEISSTNERLRHDVDQAYAVAKAMDSFLGVKGARKVVDRANSIMKKAKDNSRQGTPHNNTSDNEEDQDMSIDGVKKELDLLITYLRRVHMMCYYCGLECDSKEDLDRKCMEPHCRKSPEKKLQQDDSTPATNEKGELAWAKNLDSKLSLKYEKPRNRTLEKLGGKILEDELEDFYANNTHREHSTKYRCKVDDCNKAFKGYDYVEKHINSKHSEKIDDIKQRTTYYNNYVCDPNHLTPQQNHHKLNMNTAMAMNPNMAMNGMGMGAANLSMNRSANPSYPFVVYRPLTTNGSAPPNMVMHPANPQAFNRPPPSSTASLLDSMMPRDPRQVTSYVDLDAPSQNDSNESIFY